MLRSTILFMARNQVVHDTIVRLPPTRAVVKRFVPGETQDECVAAVRDLASRGLLSTIDYLGEDTTNQQQAIDTANAYVSLLQRLDAEGLAASAEVSVKLSAVGQSLPQGHDLAFENAGRVCAAAADAGTTVTLDMEDHTTTDRTLGMLAELRAEYPSTGAVVQAYLKRTPGDCRALAASGSRVRLCKGAYQEPPMVAHQAKAEVDASYIDCLRILMEGDGYPMVATHDPRMISTALSLANVARRAPDRYEFQMLYGIRPEEQQRLADLGHRVRVYVPFGTDWYGYFMRRLAERPANLRFFLRSLVTNS